MKQSKMLINEGRILYNVVKEAIDKAGYSLQSKNPKTVLVWYDNLRESDFYSTLKPWQVVNRIPLVNLICRKAPFIQLMNRMKVFFPTLYTFYPESMILPACNAKFQKILSNHDKKYIVKPDNGSLGYGITILSKNSVFKPFKNLSVAQEYIDSYLINDTKFDLRVYALISSISPLRIYVYHDGIARFCSEKSSANNIFSQLTNTAVNRNNPNAKIESITKTISEVFHILDQQGIDSNLIWSKIENAVILTILPALSYMKFGVSQKGLSEEYSRCFQVLGFDFILDNELNPYVLEVNYRPSLDADTEAERQLKIEMLGKAMHIGAPLENLQKIINENDEIANFSKEKWDIFYKKVIEKSSLLDQNVNTGLFNLVYPSKSAANTETYNIVLNIANRCPTKLTPHYKLPVPLKRPDPSLLPKVNDIVFYSNNFEIDDSFKKNKNIPKEQNQQKSPIKNEIENNLIQNDQQKNMAKMKLKNIESNNSFHDALQSSLAKRLQSSVISNKQEGENNTYIKKLVQEIESMKELNSNQSKNNVILKNKQPVNPKNNLQKKAVSTKQKTASSQDNVAKKQKQPNENVKQNVSPKITISQDNASKNQPNENNKQNVSPKIAINQDNATNNQPNENNKQNVSPKIAINQDNATKNQPNENNKQNVSPKIAISQDNASKNQPNENNKQNVSPKIAINQDNATNNQPNENNKQKVSPKIVINQDNAVENQNLPDENTKQNEMAEKVNASDEKSHTKLKIESHSNKQTLNQKQEEKNPDPNINENKEKANVINTEKNNEINLAKINSAKIVRSRRSASTKPISTKRSVRASSSTEHPNLDKVNKDYQNIDDFSKKYFDLITKQLKKDIKNAPNLNQSQTKSSKTNIYNYSKTTTNTQSKTLYERMLIEKAELPKTPISNASVNKPKNSRHKSIENLRNNETIKTVNPSTNQSIPDKQPQQKPPLNSTKQNTSNNTKENSSINHKACIDKEEVKIEQKETLKIKLKSRASKNCQNPKPIEKVEPNKLQNQKIESKPKQETSTTTMTTDVGPNQKTVIEPKQSVDEKVKPKPKIPDVRLETEIQFNSNNKTEIQFNSNNKTEIQFNSNNKTELIPKTKKNDVETKKNDVETKKNDVETKKNDVETKKNDVETKTNIKTEPQIKAIKRESSLEFKAKQSEVKLNKTSDLETKEKAMPTVAKSNSEFEKQKTIKTNQKLKREVNRLTKAEPKSKIENGKINSEIKKKVMKSEVNAIQDPIELKDPILCEEIEIT